MRNLAVVCFGCHQRHHAGHLRITGDAPNLQFEWQRDHDVESVMTPSPSWDWTSIELEPQDSA